MVTLKEEQARFKREFSEMLRRRRTEGGFDIREVSRVSQVCEDSIQRAEKGETFMNMQSLVNISFTLRGRGAGF